MSGRKETVLDLAKFVDKGVQVKLTGGRQVCDDISLEGKVSTYQAFLVSGYIFGHVVQYGDHLSIGIILCDKGKISYKAIVRVRQKHGI
ncbi:hypothetical protein CsSME_00011780 [Camellia sinensis var. sinensis]